MERILIIGSNGAGKSTFSYTLASKLGLPLIHIDQIYWHDNWQITPQEEFSERVSKEAKKSRWIIEGNNISTLEDRLSYADTIFWFEFPPAICLKNIFKREIHYYGRARPDMPKQCISRLNFPFLKSAITFNKRNRERIMQMLKSFPNIQVIHFTKRSQVTRYLKSL